MNKPHKLPADSLLALAASAMAAILDDPREARLEAIAVRYGMSERDARKAFIDCAGISPKRFAQFAAARAGMERLDEGDSALEASFDAGGTSAGFLHAVTCSVEAMSPGEISSGGEGLRLVDGSFQTLLGRAYAARGPRGIIQLEFLDGEPEQSIGDAQARTKARFPKALLRRDDSAFGDIQAALSPHAPPTRIALMVSGTNFQMKTWIAALGVKPGSTASYADLTREAGSPKAFRAAGSAMAANKIALLIPCHRALRAGGEIGAYKWSSWRKRAILALEAAGREGCAPQSDGGAQGERAIC